MVSETVKKKPFEGFLNRISKNNTKNEIVVNGRDISNNIPNAEKIAELIKIRRFSELII